MNEDRLTAGGFFGTSRTRMAVTFLVACAIIVFLCLYPPFVIKPLQPIVSSGPAAVSGTPDKASSFVEPIWKAKVIPTILAKAVEASVLLPEIRANPDAAGQKYGRRGPPTLSIT